MKKDPVLDEKNPYKTLEIRKWATDAEIKKAYIRLVKVFNPEVFPDQFIQIRRAYDLLRTPEKRAKIDLLLFNELPGSISYRNLTRTTDSLVKMNRCMKELEEASAGSPATSDQTKTMLNLRRERTLLYSEKKMWAEAIREWRDICGIDPTDKYSHRNRILALSRLGYQHTTHERYKEAVTCWLEILAARPNTVEILHNIGITYSLMKERTKELEYWRKILNAWTAMLKRNEDDPYLKSLILEAHKFFGGELLTSQAPSSAPVREPLPKPGDKPTATKPIKPAKVEKKVDANLERKVFNGFAANKDLGLACMDRKNWTGAIQAFKKCIEDNPDDVRILGYLGWAYLNSGDVNRPFQIWQTALRANPEDKEIRDNIVRGHLKVGENLVKQRLFGPALVHLKSVLQIAPDNSQVYIEIGNVYMMKADALSAIQNWERASELDPKNRDLKSTIRRAKTNLRTG